MERNKRDKYLSCFLQSYRVRKKAGQLPQKFDELKKLWDIGNCYDFKELGFDEKDFNEFREIKSKFNLEKQEEILNKNKIKVITINDSCYPELLKEISDPPFVLFVRGELEKKFLTIGIVGTRKPTSYGIQSTLYLSEKIAKVGITIVSGLAIGIDTVAHKGTLNSKGNTIAILGTSVDDSAIYPSINRTLANNIINQGGALVSEYPPGYPVFKYNFPERNRIISGLSMAVIIVEAKIKSGALITADFALEQNRDVFAVPGDIFRLESEGPNNLIKQGAGIITNVDDIFNTLGVDVKLEENNEENSEEENSIINCLKNSCLSIDNITKNTGLTISETLSTLSLMEIKGKIIRLSDNKFSIKK